MVIENVIFILDSVNESRGSKKADIMLWKT